MVYEHQVGCSRCGECGGFAVRGGVDKAKGGTVLAGGREDLNEPLDI